MKRYLIISIALLLTFTACTKDTLTRGLYFADTMDGMLYLELQTNEKAVMFFQGGEKEECKYKISKGQIDILGYASTKINGYTHSWWFGGALGKGTIKDGSFTIKSQRTYGPNFEYHYLTFYKH